MVTATASDKDHSNRSKRSICDTGNIDSIMWETAQPASGNSNTTAKQKMKFWYFDDKPVVKRGGITIYNNTATQQHNSKIYNY